MNEVKLVIRLAKLIRTPEQAVLVFAVCGLGIVVAYSIPHDLLER